MTVNLDPSKQDTWTIKIVVLFYEFFPSLSKTKWVSSRKAEQPALIGEITSLEVCSKLPPHDEDDP